MRTMAWETAARSRQEHRGLSVSMVLFWIFLTAAILLLLDPLNPGVDTEAGYLRLPRDIGPLKYAALAFGAMGLGLSVAGLPLFDPGRWRYFTSSLKLSWPVLLCGLFILAGSLYARFVLGIKETYLASGLAMTAFPIGLAMIAESRDPLKTVHAYFVVLLLASVYMTVEIVLQRRQGGQAFHEEIFLLVPLAVYWFLVNEKNWSAWFWVLGFAAVAIVSYKNTSYLVLLLVLGYVFWLLIARKFLSYRGDGLRRFVFGYGLTLVLIAALAVSAFALVHYQERLPSGNTDVREYVYRMAWEKFLASPIYGTAFADNTNIDFPFFPIMGQYQIINHSDWLDVLARGGALGFALFLGALFTPFWLSASRTKPAETRLRACLHGLRAIGLSGMVVMLFNPVMLNMAVGTLFWLNAGLLAGLGWQQRARRQPPVVDYS